MNIKQLPNSWSSKPVLRLIVRRRFWVAVVISLLFHAVLFLELAPAIWLIEPEAKPPVIILATLESDTLQRQDAINQTGNEKNQSDARTSSMASNENLSVPNESEQNESILSQSSPKEILPKNKTDSAATPKSGSGPSNTSAENLPVITSTKPNQRSASVAFIEKPEVSKQSKPNSDVSEPDLSESKVSKPIPKPEPMGPKTELENAVPEKSTTAKTAPSSVKSIPSVSSEQQTAQRFSGSDEQFSSPSEEEYYRQLTAHLNARLPAHPKNVSGVLRLQLRIEYGAVITAVTIIDSSGDTITDEWAKRAAISVSPVPPVPKNIAQPYFYRPTLRLSGASQP
ncbi:MAG: hypothetical protein P1U57_01620 [Oleibacter sp.]|nr:hypothetical protein [Thalassolituus sp.]